MLCYQKCKTVEFRFLRPTFNYNKITLWLYYFNAILKYSEALTKDIKGNDYFLIAKQIRSIGINMNLIIDSVYPKDLSVKLMHNYRLLDIIALNQSRNGDMCGRDTELENRLLTELI